MANYPEFSDFQNDRPEKVGESSFTIEPVEGEG